MRLRTLALTLFVLTATGCGAGLAHPPLAMVGTRPAHIIDEQDRVTDEGVAWINELVNTWVENCSVITVLRHEKVAQCREPFATPK